MDPFADGSKAPAERSVETPAVGTRLPSRRLAVRVVACGLALLLANAVAASTGTPPSGYATPWRMPRTLPTSELSDAVRAMELAASDSTTVTAFVGASPAWGDAVADGRDAVPSLYSRELADSGRPRTVFNLACDGQRMGDLYIVATRAARSADEIVVQLTYHSFAPGDRSHKLVRFPELPRLLGVPVDAQLAHSMGIPPTPRPDVTGSIDRLATAHWALYRRRDAIARATLGDTPEGWLQAKWERLTAPEGWQGETASSGNRPNFDELQPDRQLLILERYSTTTDFVLTPKDRQVIVLDRLAAELARSGKRVTFYLSPVNRSALEMFQMLDPERFGSNTNLIRRTVERHGVRFVDLNASTPLPSSAFADMNHTTAPGSRAVARQLARATLQGAEVSP